MYRRRLISPSAFLTFETPSWLVLFMVTEQQKFSSRDSTYGELNIGIDPPLPLSSPFFFLAPKFPVYIPPDRRSAQEYTLLFFHSSSTLINRGEGSHGFDRFFRESHDLYFPRRREAPRPLSPPLLVLGRTVERFYFRSPLDVSSSFELQ